MMRKLVSLLPSHRVVQVFKEILQADGRDDSLIRTLSGRQVGGSRLAHAAVHTMCCLCA